MDKVTANLNEVDKERLTGIERNLKSLIDLAQSDGYQKVLKPWLEKKIHTKEVSRAESKNGFDSIKNESKRLATISTIEDIVYFIESANKNLTNFVRKYRIKK